MPNIKSAKKRVKVIAVKTAQNKARRSNLRSTIKNAELSIAGSAENKNEIFRNTVKTIDQAAAQGIIHKNAASRKKSSLASKLNQIN